MVYQHTVNGEQIIRGGNGYLVASKSEPGAWHVVKLDGYEWVCDCKGFLNRFNCRHTRAAVADEKARRVARMSAA